MLRQRGSHPQVFFRPTWFPDKRAQCTLVRPMACELLRKAYRVVRQGTGGPEEAFPERVRGRNLPELEQYRARVAVNLDDRVS